MDVGDKVSFNVTVQPKLFGIYESTRARIRYSTNLVEIDGTEPEFRLGYSSSLGRIKIISSAEAIRNASYFLKEWAVFGILSSVATLLPLYLWLSSRGNGSGGVAHRQSK
jgi:hypothetical protein